MTTGCKYRGISERSHHIIINLDVRAIPLLLISFDMRLTAGFD
jgi:hypothetical protein